MNFKNSKHLIQFILLEVKVILKKMVHKINYLVFQPMYRYFKRVVYSDYISEWKSRRLSDESVKSPFAPHNLLNPSLNYLGTKTTVSSVEVV